MQERFRQIGGLLAASPAAGEPHGTAPDQLRRRGQARRFIRWMPNRSSIALARE
jgi:hypothetical protein